MDCESYVLTQNQISAHLCHMFLTSESLLKKNVNDHINLFT